MIQAANASLKVKLKNKKRAKDKKWFDKELKDLKREVWYNSRLLQQHPNTPEVRKSFFISLKSYNKLRKKKRRQFKEETLRKLDNLRISQPQAYWKLLNSPKEQNSNTENISLEE